MGFRPWGYKMNSPSTGLITEQYSLSLIYYSVYEFFLFFPSGHRFPFLSPFIWMLANCKIVLLHVLRPCAINLHSWCLWNGCIEHGWHIASHRVTWANVPLELSLCLLSTSWLQKLPGIGHYMQKPPINSIIRKSLFFFFFLVPRWLLFCFSSEPLALCWGQPRTLTVRIRLHQMSAHPCVGVLPAT